MQMQTLYWVDKAQFEGDLGRVYGCQWRDWRGPQNKKVFLISTLKTNPYDRRLVISAWNPGEVDDMYCLSYDFSIFCWTFYKPQYIS